VQVSEPRFCLLVHQLPPRPRYLRAQVRQRLARVGALALKNSVYALPLRDECVEDLQWIAQEAAAAGGEAFTCEARFLSGVDTRGLVKRFQALREADYRRLLGELRRKGAGTRLPRLRKRLAEVVAIDFFGAAARQEVEREMKKLEKRTEKPPAARQATALGELRGRTWVTRRDPHVDRLASAWLVRRFVDPRARFRFVDPKAPKLKPRELGFDMPGGAFTHEGGRCTFEVLVERLALRDPALVPIAEIVHDIDLKDARFSRAETDGVRSLLAGLYRTTPDDAERLERGVALFDDLYQSFR
jgi:hypothetical protein